jgi:hypothetical protein
MPWNDVSLPQRKRLPASVPYRQEHEMYNEERARILNMVAAGQVLPGEAGDLLAALDPSPQAGFPLVVAAPLNSQLRPMPGRSLVIRIIEEDAARVNLRIPLSLARAAGRFLPRQAKAALKEFEIDLDQLLEDVSGSAGNGALIEVHDKDTLLFIGVE